MRLRVLLIQVAAYFRGLREKWSGRQARRAAEMEEFVASEVRRLNSERARKGWATRRAKAVGGGAAAGNHAEPAVSGSFTPPQQSPDLYEDHELDAVPSA